MADSGYGDSAVFALDVSTQTTSHCGDSDLFPLDSNPRFSGKYSDSSAVSVDSFRVNKTWADSETFGVMATKPITVITHGYRPLGTLPNWPLTMAQAIRIRAGAGRVLLYNKTTGIFEVQQPSDSYGETILVFNWAAESSQDYYGHSETAGDALFAALIMGKQRGDFDFDNIHLIGHSRGCVVNSEAAERLIAAGYLIKQVTTLDPVDSGWSGICDDYDVNPSLGDIGFVSWIGVDWADNYWSDDGGLDGRDFPGTYPTYLGNSINHSDVHEWYLGTIDLVSGEEGWYGGAFPTREEGGYYYSRIVGGSRQGISGEQTSIAFTFESGVIINGDFQRGPMADLLGLPFPGWSEHGGGGPGHFDNGYLELDLGKEWRRHNRFYVPSDAIGISFYFDVTNQTETGNELVVYMGEEIASNIIGAVTLDYLHSGWKTCTVPVEKRGTVQTITFKIAYGPSVSSQVRIDDVYMGLCTRIYPADFDCNNAVDIVDLMYLCNQWLETPGNPSADIAPEPNGDNFVDFRDFALFAENWLNGVTP